MSLARRVRELRQALDPPLSQQELARAIGADVSYVSRVENGHIKLPRAELLRPLARALRTSVGDLLHAAGYLPADELAPIAGDSGDPRYQDVLRRAGQVRDPERRQLLARLIESVLVQEDPRLACPV